MTLKQLTDSVKALVAADTYRFAGRGTHPALPSLPPGLWLLPGPNRDATDLTHWMPPYPVHPLEAVASKGCYGAVSGDPTREQCAALMTARGRFAVAVNVWGKALGVSPRVAAAWFFAFTPLGVPRSAGLRLLSEQVWADLGFTAEAARAAAFEAGERTDPPTRRDTFWDPEHVEYPADVDRVYLDRVVPVGE